MKCYQFKDLVEDFIVFAPNKKDARKRLILSLRSIKKNYVHIYMKGFQRALEKSLDNE